ncbi:LPD29 domain-containing protein [Variovorax sp. LT1P1]|uniref:LPD29 domain-containing protein n=1 Tax=Variovorax sp. LT1P1 TaxID=3443730 RepID=UPI003F44AC2B
MTTKYLTNAETSKLVRQSLKEAFPDVKFSVRGKTYSGGSSLSVSWTDGPNEAQVDAVVGKFQSAYFDSGIDYKGSVHHMMDGQPVRFCADFMHFTRSYSDAAVQRGLDRVSRTYAGNLREAGVPTLTVEQWRKGDLLYVQLFGGSHNSIQRIAGEFIHKHSDRMSVKHSPTAGRVFITHDDGYGRACGTGAGALDMTEA